MTSPPGPRPLFDASLLTGPPRAELRLRKEGYGRLAGRRCRSRPADAPTSRQAQGTGEVQAGNHIVQKYLATAALNVALS